MQTLLSLVVASCFLLVSPSRGQVSRVTLEPVAEMSRPFVGHIVARITPRTAGELLAISNISESIWSCNVGVGPIDAQLSPNQRLAIDQLGIPYSVFIPDVQAELDREQREIEGSRNLQGGFGNRDDSWFTSYHDLSGIDTRLVEFATLYPGIATTIVAGMSLEGRPLMGIRISTPDLPGNPASARPAVLFAGGQHAREWVNPATVMYIADRLLREYGTVQRTTDLLNSAEIIVVPVQNPDGYAFTWASSANRLWRKNRRTNSDGTRGVDLNRNWGFGWGGPGASATPSSDTYRGPSGFSEPETASMRDFITANPRLHAHIDFHSYSQLVMSPWGYTAELPSDATLFDRINRSMANGIFLVHGKAYDYGPIYTAIYPASGGAVDWAFGDRGILSLTIELRDSGQFGFVLPADQILPTAEENFEAAMRLAEFTTMPLLLSQDPAPPASLVADQPLTVGVRVKAGTSILGLADPFIYFRQNRDETFVQIAASQAGPGYFTGDLPGVSCGSYPEWYFEAVSINGDIVRLPPLSATDPTVFTCPVIGEYVTFADSMETDTGWSMGVPTDTATSGNWERADPQGTAAQPEDDATSNGTLCWITGAAAGGSVGAFDVDGGATTLTSPLFSALPPAGVRATSTYIQYARWFSNNQGSSPNLDTLRVEYSTDGGAIWNQLESVAENAGLWRTVAYRLDILRAPTSTMRLRFIASDLDGGSIVEAGIDDVRIYVRGCPLTADFDGDGDIDSDDIIAFFSAWDAGSNAADYDNSGATDSDDIVAFFTLWDEGR